ncbi:amidase-like protein [Emericellopsis atlantica]|uniref:Amidase-like protein n=1 Tax=Emericellopsis atlantica TaxID=2614577 RepID=A0A9P7ZLM5_9HYPO|nr:amidase-like protein [Emericellopsis atlantica]KAG9254379.1 amidase-like protein [Emericellopsis atlantica]
MKFSEIDLAAFYRASGEKPVFESRSSLESDDSDLAKSATRISTVIEVGELSYLCEETPFHSSRLSDSSAIKQLASFIPPEGPISCQSLQKVIQHDLQDDDVLSSSFLISIVLFTQETSLDRETLGLLSSFGYKRLFLTNTNIGKGPFFFSCNGMFRVFRLYPDTHDAFVTSVIPSLADRNTYQSISASAYGQRTKCVAVPSRLYFKRTKELPLAGIRLSVKDVFHLKGVVTTNGNRAYESLYGEQDVSSAAGQAAIDKGAIIVGKAITVEFAGAQEVEGDWADFRYPKNPRADGYLRATGSSVGSACGMATYPWLDGSLGSDCGESIRDPAVAFGVAGFRASHDGIQEKNTSVPCPRFQRTGYLTRDMKTLCDLTHHAVRRLFDDRESWRPKRVVTINEYASGRTDVDALFTKTAEKLTKFLGTELVKVSLEDTWECTKPIQTDKGFLSHYAKTFMTVVRKDYYDSGAKFREDYQRKFDAAPFVAQTTRYLWGGATEPPAEFEEALQKVKEHNEWFSKNIVDESTIMVIPRFSLDRRDEYLPRESLLLSFFPELDANLRSDPWKREWMVWDSNLHASIGGCPNLMMPIGQLLGFESDISQRQEVFPVTLAITGAHGTDLAILRLIHDFLAEHGPATGVQPGKSAYPDSMTF